MKTIVDGELCLGCGVCEATCPDVFQMGDANNKATVKLDPVPPALQESCREAAHSCPEEAIKIEE
ncbi:MAG: ferredoxin [Thermoguttaceae bacterium]